MVVFFLCRVLQRGRTQKAHRVGIEQSAELLGSVQCYPWIITHAVVSPCLARTVLISIHPCCLRSFSYIRFGTNEWVVRIAAIVASGITMDLPPLFSHVGRTRALHNLRPRTSCLGAPPSLSHVTWLVHFIIVVSRSRTPPPHRLGPCSSL